LVASEYNRFDSRMPSAVALMTDGAAERGGTWWLC
jgi:hypothetical protein